MQKTTTPAQLVINRFGGVRALARKLEVYPSTVSRWAAEEGKKGTGGQIPGRYHVALLDMAKKENIYLTAEELIRGSDA